MQVYRMVAVIIVALFLLGSLMLGCDSQGYGQFPDPPAEETPSDGDTVDPGMVVKGVGSCADPFYHGSDGRGASYSYTGDLGDATNEVTGSSCAPDANAAARRVNIAALKTLALQSRVADGDAPADGDAITDGDASADGDAPADGDAITDGDASADGDSPVDGDAITDGDIIADGDTPVDGDAITDGDTTQVDGDAITDGDIIADGDSSVDGDAIADGDTQVDGDAIADGDTAPVDGDAGTDGDVIADGDAETDGEAPIPFDLGEGPDIALKLPLGDGDILKVSFTGTNFDAMIYVLRSSCDDEASCETIVDATGVGEEEMLEFRPTESGDYFIILDSKESDASGEYTYGYELESLQCEGVGTQPEDGFAGAACSESAECETGMCLNEETLTPLLGPGIVVPNGYCSRLGACDESVGGFTVGAGFIGPDFSLFKLCLRPCDTDCDCRTADGQVCLDPMSFVEKGLMDEETVTEYFGDNNACMPGDLVSLIEQGLRENQ